MTRSFRPAAIGIAAAVRVPFWVRGERLRRALGEGAETTRPAAEAEASDGPDRELALALRASTAALRVLGHARPLWRNTCLYRSVAQWLVLTAFGRRAAVRIGVRAQPSEQRSPVTAHAWVDYAGSEPVEPRADGYETLRGALPDRATAAL